MDPLSITASALGLAAHVLRTAFFVKEAIDQLRDAPEITHDIEDDIMITQAALRQVEAALGHDPQAIWRFRLDDVFDVSVKGCLGTLQRIDAEFESFFGRDDWRARLGIWWNSGEIRRLLGRLEAKKGGLMLLVQALSLRSVQEMQNLLQQNRATLDIARQGLEDMVPSYPAYKDEVLESVASEIASDDSVLGDRDSVISHTRFPFDDICFGTKAYQRAVARVSSKKAHQPKKKGSVPVRDSYLPSAGDSETETESEPSSEKATITAPAVVESAVHEAVCLRLQEAEARIRALEAKIQQEATKKIGDQSPGVSLKNEVLQEQLLLSELVREVSSTSEAMDYAKVGAVDEHAGAHEDGENNDKPSNLQSERYDHHDKSDIPFPLRYVPYQPERRGLSPVPEVPEYTAGHTRHTKAALDCLGTHTIDSSGRAKAKQIANDSGRGDRSRRRPTVQDDDGEGKRITDNGGPFLASMVGKDHDGSASGSAEPVIKPNSTHKITRSQTSLLIEYFESGKGKASGDVRKPSVRVRLTPTPKRQTGLHQQGIAVTKRQPLHGDGDRHHLPSEISAIPPDTFLDGSGTGRSKHSLDPTAPKIRDRLAADGRLKPKEPRARKSRSRSSSLTESAQRAQGRTRTSHARVTALAAREVPLVAPNPKLLETVEDAIKRLILPELDAVKRRQKKRMEPDVAKCEDQ